MDKISMLESKFNQSVSKKEELARKESSSLASRWTSQQMRLAIDLLRSCPFRVTPLRVHRLRTLSTLLRISSRRHGHT
eukprot:6186888-Pleurochrysis_carterae.AAC.1